MGNLYVVIEPEEIVAQDLAYAITAFDPAAQVEVFHHPDQALDALKTVIPAAVIANVHPTRLFSNLLGHILEERAIPFAFTGVVAEFEAAGAPILASPFSETTVAALLRQLLPP